MRHGMPTRANKPTGAMPATRDTIETVQSTIHEDAMSENILSL